MNYYALKFGLSAGTSQSEIMQQLKSNGCDVIQTSDGLCVKSQKDLPSLQALLAKYEPGGFSWEQMDTGKALLDEGVAADVKAFLKSE